MVTPREQETFLKALLDDDEHVHCDLASAMLSEHEVVEVIASCWWPLLVAADRLRREDVLPDRHSRRVVRRLGRLSRRLTCGQWRSSRGRLSALVISGAAFEDECFADAAAALLESAGVVTRTCGGGVPVDDLLEELQQRPVDLLMVVSIGPSDAPEMRRLFDAVHVLPARIRPGIVAGGGLFARAEGLATEMGADLEISSPEVLQALFEHEQVQPLVYSDAIRLHAA